MATVGLFIIFLYGGRQVIAGDLTLGGMFAFLIYIINVPPPVRKISSSYTKLKLGAVTWQRIGVLGMVNNNIAEGKIELIAPVGRVNFSNVSFSYSPGVGILRAISLIAKPGEVIAIVGPSGAGKSSFANLLLRLFDPTKGEITIDDIDIKQYKISSLRKHIGFIQQEPILFNTSILENIRYGNAAATLTEVIEAAKQANAYEFIMDLPQGYASVVREMGGGLLSGGQRIAAVARAGSSSNRYLLDEPTAPHLMLRLRCK